MEVPKGRSRRKRTGICAANRVAACTIRGGEGLAPLRLPALRLRSTRSSDQHKHGESGERHGQSQISYP